MKGIVNRLDQYGNSAAHYAKPYPDQSVAKLLLKHGAKIEINEQGAVNLHPRTLEEHLFENCIATEGEDVDDEEFRIRIFYTLFEKPVENHDKNLNKGGEKKTAWALMEQGQMEGKGKKKSKELEGGQGTGKVDTKRLEYFSDVDSLHYLLKHPVLNSFLELELNSLKWRYLFDFLFYFAFVLTLFFFLSAR